MATPSPQIKFTSLDTTYDFGDVPAQSVAQYKFEFKNTGKEDLIIKDAHCALPIARVTWPATPVRHGKKGIITVILTPLEIGTFKDDVYITSNATALPYPFLHISGAIIPEGDPGTSGTSSSPKGRRSKQ